MRLLLAEPDRIAAEGLADKLRQADFQVDVVRTGAAVLDAGGDVELILLSLDLPDLDGLEVCRRLRRRCQIPIIGLSFQDAEIDRVLGLQAGLDDYVAKPPPLVAGEPGQPAHVVHAVGVRACTPKARVRLLSPFGRFSTTVTDTPAVARSPASSRPVGPAPATTTSLM